MLSQRYCDSRPPERTWADLTAESLMKAHRELEAKVGPAKPGNYAMYKPTVDALLNAKKPMNAEEVSKITGRWLSLEYVVLNNLQQAGLLEKTRKDSRNIYKLQSIEKVHSHFAIEKDVSKRE